jgi:hypothetical protein
MPDLPPIQRLLELRDYAASGDKQEQNPNKQYEKHGTPYDELFSLACGELTAILRSSISLCHNSLHPPEQGIRPYRVSRRKDNCCRTPNPLGKTLMRDFSGEEKGLDGVLAP